MMTDDHADDHAEDFMSVESSYPRRYPLSRCIIEMLDSNLHVYIRPSPSQSMPRIRAANVIVTCCMPCLGIAAASNVNSKPRASVWVALVLTKESRSSNPIHVREECGQFVQA
jgi:hypothetical protein